MGTTLTGKVISATYDALLKVTDNDAITSTAKRITDGLGNDTPLYISTTRIGIGVSPTTTFHVSGNSQIGGNLTVTGDLLVEGSTTTIDTETLSVEDPLIIVGSNNTTSDAVDLGIYGVYDTSGSQNLYAGIFRRAADSKFHLFKDLQTEPTTTVNTSGTGYTKADLVIGNLEATGADFTGQVSLPDGSVANPALNFTSDVDTGISYDLALKLVFAGAEAVKITSANVDIKPNGTSVLRVDTTGVNFFQDAIFGNDIKALFGGSSDLQIYHNGTDTNSYIENETGELYILNNSDDKKIIFQTDNGVGGTTDYFIINGLENTNEFVISSRHNDDVKAFFGDSNDLQIFHDGDDSFVQDFGTGDFYVRSNSTLFLKSATTTVQAYGSTETIANFIENGAVELYYDNSKKLETTTTGVTVTGAVSATTFSGQLDGTISSTTTATTQTQGDNSTKVATTAYVDSAIGGQDTLAEILANGNTTGGTDIAITSGDKITNFTSTGIDDNATSTAITIDSSENVGINDTVSGNFNTNYDTKLLVGGEIIARSLTANQSMVSIGGDSTSAFIKSGKQDGSLTGRDLRFVRGTDEKLRVTSTGVSVTGNVDLRDDDIIQLGDSDDLKIYHNTFDQEDSIIEATNHNLRIINTANDSNVTIQTDDGSGGIANYIIANGSNGRVELYHYGTKKLETISSGVSITDDLYVVENFDVIGDFTLGSFGVDAYLMTSSVSGAQVNINGNLKVTGEFIDSSGDSGTSGQILSSTGTGTNWIDNDTGTIDGSGTANTVTMWSDTDTITDAPITISGNNATFAGNVTINKASNPTKLQIGSSLADDPFIHFQTDGENYSVGVDRSDSNKFKISNGSTVATNTRITLNTAGNVGIGTTNPAVKLNVAITSGNHIAKFEHSSGAGYAPASLLLQAGEDSGRGQGIYYYNTGADENWFVGIPYNVSSKKWIIANKYATSQQVDTAQLTHALLTIDSDTGNVGIGTDSPSAKLHVDNSLADAIIRLSKGSSTIGNIDFVNEGNRFSIQDDGAKRLVIDTSGQVGIGTDSPSQKLDVDSGHIAVDAGYGLVWSGDANRIVTPEDNTTGGLFKVASGAATRFMRASSESMRIDGSGNVGIGTTLPSAKLDIKGTAGSPATSGTTQNGILRIQNATNNNTLDIGQVAGTPYGTWLQAADKSDLNPIYTYPLILNPNGGNVGIGETNPDVKLKVVGNGNSDTDVLTIGNFEQDDSGDETANIKFELTRSYTNTLNPAGYIKVGKERAWSSSGGRQSFMSFLTRNGASDPAERMRINSSGDVEFKPANPVSMAGVDTNYLGFRITQTNSQSALLGTIYGQGVSGWGGRLVFRTKPDNGSPNDSTSIAMVINEDQYVGIGETSPNSKLYVKGSSSVVAGRFWGEAGTVAPLELAQNSGGGFLAKFYSDTFSTVCGSISHSGSATAFNTSSDYRLKENVVEMTGALDRVEQLKPSRFNFIGHEEIVDGFLAHEVSDIVPEAITGTKDEVDAEGNPVYQGIDQSKLVPLLVGAIQELKAEIETLKAQIN